MPDHPQSSVTEPAEAFRETFLYWIENPRHHETARRFGALFEELVGEARLVVRNPREKTPDPTWVAATVHAALLDLASLRSTLADIGENIGAPLPANEVRLMVTVAELLPELDGFAGKLRSAFDRAIAERKS